MSKNRRSVIDMGKNLVPPRPFLTPVSALAVVRERLARLVGISPVLRGIDFGYEDAPKKIHVRGDTTTGCTGNPSCCPACGVEAWSTAHTPALDAPGRATVKPPSGKRMLATEET